MLFVDRREAGQRLAERLPAFRGPDIVVVGPADGGLVVAAEVATRLRVLLDVLVVHELRCPRRPDPAFGAIAEPGVRVVDAEMARGLPTPAAELTRVERRERAALRRRAERFRGMYPRLSLAGCTVVVVDETLYDAAAARAACRAAYAYGAIRVVVAAPIATTTAAAALATDADKVVTLHLEDELDEPDRYYRTWTPFGDDEVCAALDAATSAPPSCSHSGPVRLAV